MEPLDGLIRNYAWGSRTAIPELRNTAIPELRNTAIPELRNTAIPERDDVSSEPIAEVWFGAHSTGSASLPERGITLIEAIEQNPVGELGEQVVARYGPRLPFLLKLLAAAAPLSLQVHPSMEQARAGFDQEERLGVPLDAKHRLYRDPFHKPEMLTAIEPFVALVGFRPVAATVDLLRCLHDSALEPLIESLELQGLESTARRIIDGSFDVSKAVAAFARGTADDSHWRAEATLLGDIARRYPGDVSVVLAALLDRIEIEPGAAVYLDAGVPHSYISGLGVEIMANSDNVLRAGLTPKHVDPDELSKVVLFDDKRSVRVQESVLGVLPSPAREFDMFSLSGRDDLPLPAGRPGIVLATAGTIVLQDMDRRVEVLPGEAAWVSATDSHRTITLDGVGAGYLATVGALD